MEKVHLVSMMVDAGLTFFSVRNFRKDYLGERFHRDFLRDKMDHITQNTNISTSWSFSKSEFRLKVSDFKSSLKSQ